MVQLQDEPIADPVCVPVYYVSKLARDNGVIVCQVGEGADELFCGYPTLEDDAQAAAAATTCRCRGRAQARWRWPACGALGKDERSRVRVRCAAAPPASRCSGAAPRRSPTREKQRLLSPRLRREFAGVTLVGRARADPAALRGASAWEPSHLNWMTYLDLNLRLPELLLMRVDKMSMGVSLEGRVPFLDHKFVELALSIPSDGEDSRRRR